MIIKLKTKNFTTTVDLPASKSESNRALILKALSAHQDSDAELINLSDAEDTVTLHDLLNNEPKEFIYNVGHAGTAMRFLTAYFAQKNDSKVVLTGSERMQNRPIMVLVKALCQLGASVDYIGKEGFPPLLIKGKTIEGGELIIDSTVSSQYLSALLMIAPLLKNGLKLTLEGKTVSEPYLDMTVSLMNDFGVEVTKKDNTYLVLPQSYYFKTIQIESDWSAASYWYQLAALSESCEIALKGLKRNSRQGDSQLVELFSVFGVSTTWNEEGILITKHKTTKIDFEKEYHFNLERTPDLAQTIICTCAGLGLKTRITGLSTLKIKETDRLLALQTELKKLNVILNRIGEETAELLNTTQIAAPNVPIATYEDHRMAMAFAPLALIVGQLNIENPEVVKKSYPNFWSDLNMVFNVVI